MGEKIYIDFMQMEYFLSHYNSNHIFPTSVTDSSCKNPLNRSLHPPLTCLGWCLHISHVSEALTLHATSREACWEMTGETLNAARQKCPPCWLMAVGAMQPSDICSDGQVCRAPARKQAANPQVECSMEWWN